MMIVVAALIEKNGKYLIARRSTGASNALGKWEFPGGKVREGESEECAIEREIREEFDIKIKADKFLVSNRYKYPTKEIDLRLYRCEIVSGTFSPHDHSEYVFAQKDEIINYDLCPADIAFARYLMKET